MDKTLKLMHYNIGRKFQLFSNNNKENKLSKAFYRLNNSLIRQKSTINRE